MFQAYIKTDEFENPAVIKNLTDRLSKKQISWTITNKHWKDILSIRPFLYYRNPYIRFEDEDKVISFHQENPQFPLLKALDGEVVSVNSTADGGCDFTLFQNIYYHVPDYEPLPILLGTHKRLTYLRLTMNSLLHTAAIPGQRIYIVASEPDAETLAYLQNLLINEQVTVDVVVSNVNLKYSFANFGAKFFSLRKFIHYEDDGIMPENVNYFMPYWTQQLHYRSTTADLVGFRVSESNWNSGFYRCDMFTKSKPLEIPNDTLWHYSKKNMQNITPLGGLATVINCETMMRGFDPPNYCTSDHILYVNSKIICIANVPIYHIGANQEIDYYSYSQDKKRLTKLGVDQFQEGRDLRTGITKKIDLANSWLP